MDRQIFHKHDALDDVVNRLLWNEQRRVEEHGKAVAEAKRAADLFGVCSLILVGAAVFIMVLGVAKFGVGR